MSFHRATLVAVATFLTVGMTSVAFAGCCDWGAPAPVAYAPGGCGTCGTAYAPIVYATPIAPSPITVGGCGVCGTPTIAAAFGTYGTGYGTGWNTGCGYCGAQSAPVSYYGTGYDTGCGTCGAPPSYYGNGCGGCQTQAVYTTPAPLYVVNQGPDYSGPGLMVPYRTYAPPAEYAPPPAYPPYLNPAPGYYPGPVYRHAYYRPRGYGYGYGYAPRWRGYGYGRWRG
jgi:hypothetical protein